MLPLAPTRDLLGLYTEAIQAHLTRGADLDQARELGHMALATGLGAAQISAIHHESLNQLGIQIAGPEDSRLAPREGALDRAAGFLGECLMPFDGSQRELRRSNIALRHTKLRMEAELERISTIVYDDALQLVSAARLALSGHMGELPSYLATILDQLDDRLASCCGALHTRLLEDLGLESAIQFLSRRFAAACQWDVTTEAAIGPLPPEVGIALYGAVLEALTNVHRHARAKRVRIRLCEECSVIQCSIRDDGIGFDVSRILSDGEAVGAGFVYIQESLRGVGGTLVVDSAPGGGTEVRISVCPRTRD